MAELRRFKDKEGHVFSLTAEQAATMGFTPVKPDPEPEPEPAPVVEDKAVEKPAANKAVKASANKGK